MLRNVLILLLLVIEALGLPARSRTLTSRVSLLPRSWTFAGYAFHITFCWGPCKHMASQLQQDMLSGGKFARLGYWSFCVVTAQMHNCPVISLTSELAHCLCWSFPWYVHEADCPTARQLHHVGWTIGWDEVFCFGTVSGTIQAFAIMSSILEIESLFLLGMLLHIHSLGPFSEIHSSIQILGVCHGYSKWIFLSLAGGELRPDRSNSLFLSL